MQSQRGHDLLEVISFQPHQLSHHEYLCARQFDLTHPQYFRIFRINDLPPEILTNIFLLVAWGVGYPYEGLLNKLRITWVCRQWRQVAISECTLWSSIWFRPPFERGFAFIERAKDAMVDLRISDLPSRDRTPIPPTLSDSFLQLAESEEQRRQAKDQLASLGLQAPIPFQPNQMLDAFTLDQQTMNNILTRLSPRISSIRTLSIMTEDWQVMSMVLSWLAAAGSRGIRIRMQHLDLQRTWTARPNNDQFLPPNAEVQPLFGGAPAPELQVVCLRSIPLDWRTTTLSRLTALDIRWIPPSYFMGAQQFRAVLHSSPALESLKVDAVTISDFSLDESPIVLGHLHTLSFGNLRPIPIMQWCSQIHAPEVRDLTFLNCKVYDYSPVWRFMTGRFSKVKILTIFSVHLATFDIIATFSKMLHSMPDVELLRAADIGLDVWMSFLSRPDTGASHPRVAAMTIQESWTRPIEDTAPTGTMSYRPLPEEAPSIPTPRLRILEVHSVKADDVARFAICRRLALSCPVQGIYIIRHPSLQQQDVEVIRRHIPQLSVVPHGIILNEEVPLRVISP